MITGSIGMAWTYGFTNDYHYSIEAGYPTFDLGRTLEQKLSSDRLRRRW